MIINRTASATKLAFVGFNVLLRLLSAQPPNTYPQRRGPKGDPLCVGVAPGRAGVGAGFAMLKRDPTVLVLRFMTVLILFECVATGIMFCVRKAFKTSEEMC